MEKKDALDGYPLLDYVNTWITSNSFFQKEYKKGNNKARPMRRSKPKATEPRIFPGGSSSYRHQAAAGQKPASEEGIIMFKTATAIALLVLATTTVRADVGIDAQVITTGTEVKVLEPGPNLQAIVDDITVGPGEVYLLKLGPGLYVLNATLKMKPFVSIAGSGVEATFLTGAIGSPAPYENSAIVSLVADMTLSDLTIANNGSGDYSSGIFNGSSTLIQNVRVGVSGAAKGNFGINNVGGATTITNVLVNAEGTVTEEIYGVYNSSASPIMTNVVISAAGQPTNFGVYNANSSPLMNNVTATASGGSNSTGVANVSDSSPVMSNVNLLVSGTVDNKGVFNSAGSSPTMSNVTAAASGGSSNWGVFNFDATSQPKITRSTLVGSTAAMNFGGSTGTRISDTQLDGGIDADPDTGTTQCRNTYDGLLADVGC